MYICVYLYVPSYNIYMYIYNFFSLIIAMEDALEENVSVESADNKVFVFTCMYIHIYI
jgi:hypothetical protein